jgi:hypothetical protein
VSFSPFDSGGLKELLSVSIKVRVDAMPAPPTVTAFDQQVRILVGGLASGVSVDPSAIVGPEKNQQLWLKLKGCQKEVWFPLPGIPFVVS